MRCDAISHDYTTIQSVVSLRLFSKIFTIKIAFIERRCGGGAGHLEEDDAEMLLVSGHNGGADETGG